jgi:hypothetical protein
MIEAVGITPCDLGFAIVAEAELLASAQQFGARLSMYHSINATATA